MTATLPLLIGEVFVDVTLMPTGTEPKLRLGGVVHAARGLWALRKRFAVAAFVPDYLKSSAERYLIQFGCKKFITAGDITGAPNVMLIFDATEVDDQQYRDLLVEEKSIELNDELTAKNFLGFKDALVFPGRFELASICKLLPKDIRLHIDAAYDVSSFQELRKLKRSIKTIFMSTSSGLFRRAEYGGINELAAQ